MLCLPWWLLLVLVALGAGVCLLVLGLALILIAQGVALPAWSRRRPTTPPPPTPRDDW